ncbi:MAG TPA: class I SAM-dependent rRNA methyltransferase [Silvibacterium sp.]|nr:class I SAM-dependent rRNA methyltransferase [Silvibacterium sp.]
MISKRAADRLRAGHVWVYRSDVEQVVPDFCGNDLRLMAVVDPRGLPLGTALYSASSQIALRVVSSRQIDGAAWIALFQERLRLAIQYRRSLLSAEARLTNACRLVFSEADLLPGLIADRYNDLVVLQLQTQAMNSSAITAACLEILRERVDPRAIYERSDPRIRELEEIGPSPGGSLYSRDCGDAATAPSTTFSLNGLGFHYDASSGQKTGAFLDQRENYAAAARYCRGEALDVCTYQGGFALHLARVCRRVTGVDASRGALEVAERNLDLNRESLGDTEVDWIEANAFDLLRDWSHTGARFDSIVLDPPAFAKSRRAAEGALRGYKELNLRAIKMLRPGGTLVTCSCSHHIGIEDFTSIVTAAAGDARRSVRLLERRGAAADHPVLLGVPETEYLKCLVCRVS